MINLKFKIANSSLFGNILIIILFAGVFFLKFYVISDNLMNRFRPVDLVLFASILILGLGINKSTWLDFYAKYRLVIFSIFIIIFFAFLDLIFRAQWKEITIDIYSLFYLLIPLYLFIILKVRINFTAIFYVNIIFILITMILIIESIASLQTTSRMVLLGTFSDPNHTSSWLVGATFLALALYNGASYRNQLFFVTTVLIFCGLTDSNASNLSIFVITAYSISASPKFYNLAFSKKVFYLFSMIIILILTLNVIPKVVSNIVISKQHSFQSLNVFISEASPKPSPEASPKPFSLIDSVQNFNFDVLKPTRVDQVTESRRILFSQAILKFKNNPLGVGFDETLVKVPSSGAMMGIHNIFLTFLVAHGVVGLLALIFLFYSLYRYGGFYSRAYLLSMVTVGFFQESFSWRHQWLFLALFYIIDENHKTKSEKSSALVQ
jgi:hypothetical protein